LIVIFRDLSIYSRKSLAVSLLPIWRFFNTLSSLFVGHIVFGVDLDPLERLFDSASNERLPLARRGQFTA
jgi:hypothetical protein